MEVRVCLVATSVSWGCEESMSHQMWKLAFVAIVDSGESLLAGMARKRGTENTGLWRAIVGGTELSDVGGVVDQTGV